MKTKMNEVEETHRKKRIQWNLMSEFRLTASFHFHELLQRLESG